MIQHLVAFDFETAGLSSKRFDVIEVGAVRFGYDGGVMDTYHSMANPGHPLSSEIVSITGITDAMLAGAPAPLEAVRAFHEWAGTGAVFLAHNAPFDMRFFNATFLKAGEFVPPLPVVDTLRWARTRISGTTDHKLGTLLDHIGADVGGLHRALADAHGVAALTTHLLQGHADPSAELVRWLDQPSAAPRATTFEPPAR